MARNFATCHPEKLNHAYGLCAYCANKKTYYPTRVLSGKARDSNWKIKLKQLYKITIEQFNEMIESQNNKCAICKKEETKIDKRIGKPRRLSIDHCHKTLKVRGLLCCRCNRALGMFEDNIELLELSIKYLKKTNNET